MLLYPILQRKDINLKKENYTGENAAEEFIKRLEEDIKEICNIKKRLMIYGKRENEQFLKATKCWICNKEFEEGDKKVRDHCHFTGRYRGAAHNSCNLRYLPNFTPVVFHNLSGYDTHLFIKNLGFSEEDIKCIPNNEERYISFSKEIEVGSYEKEVKDEKTGETKKEVKHIRHEIRFIDSFKFMATSLDKLMIYPKKILTTLKGIILVKNLIYLLEKEFILMNIWILQKGLKKLSFHRKKHFILGLMVRILVMKIMNMLEKFGKRSE